MTEVGARVIVRCKIQEFYTSPDAGNQSSVHFRVDSDVLEWLEAQGKGHLTRMNAVLRSYVAARKHDERR